MRDEVAALRQELLEAEKRVEITVTVAASVCMLVLGGLMLCLTSVLVGLH